MASKFGYTRIDISIINDKCVSKKFFTKKLNFQESIPKSSNLNKKENNCGFYQYNVTLADKNSVFLEKLQKK